MAGSYQPPTRPFARELNVDVHFSPEGGCTATIVKTLDGAKETALVQA